MSTGAQICQPTTFRNSAPLPFIDIWSIVKFIRTGNDLNLRVNERADNLLYWYEDDGYERNEPIESGPHMELSYYQKFIERNSTTAVMSIWKRRRNGKMSVRMDHE